MITIPYTVELVSAFAAPLYALPLDAFRLLAGVVSFFYFARTLRETPDFTGPDGLIDHSLAHRLLPPTRLGLFQPGIPAWVFRLVFVLACLASAMLALGVLVKPSAAYLFLVAVSTYRWNMLVTYVDDAIMHIVLFWLILLPVGRTLTLQEWLREGNAAFSGWMAVTVPGGATRLFLLNLAIAYFVAGVYKWTSPMWRDGSALFAILKLPIAFAPDRLALRHLPFFRAGNYVALAVEPFFPLLFVLPAGSFLKWLILASLVGFHLGIVATLKIPFANLAMLGAIPIALHDELMVGLLRLSAPTTGSGIPLIGPAEWVALALVGAISTMLLLEVHFIGRFTSPPLWKTSVSGFRRNPACVALWCVGIAQSYRLFDWIDLRNYHARYEVFERAADGGSRRIDPAEIFPRSIRHLLLQSYLHGSIWHQIDPAGLREARRAILERYARRYARRRGNSGTLEVHAIRQRVTSDNLMLTRGVRRPLLRFSCQGGEPAIEYVSLDPEAPGSEFRPVPASGSVGEPLSPAAAAVSPCAES